MPGARKTKVRVAERDPVAEILRSVGRLRSGISLLDTTKAPPLNEYELARAIRAGLAPTAWLELRRIGFTMPELSAALGVSEKTISRKQRSHERLAVVEGDRTLRLAQVALDAAEAFGDLEKAMRWLRKPNLVLGGDKPLDLIATEPGTALVRQALGTVEYGGVA